LPEIATYELQEPTAIPLTSVELTNLDVDEGMIASGETEPTDLGFELRLLPTPRTQHSETISGDHPAVTISAAILLAPPPLLVHADRPHLRLFDVDTVTPRTYPTVREFATGRSIPSSFLDWIRSFVDADFTNEEWGDSYMMPIEGQPKYYHCVDLLPHPQRASDWDIIWRAMNDEGENVENNERKKDKETNQRISEESLHAALRPRGLPNASISEPMEKQDDEEFQEFAAVGARRSQSLQLRRVEVDALETQEAGIIWLRRQYELAQG
jgi:hypothetical protein